MTLNPQWRDGLPVFHPRRYCNNGHIQTIAGNFLPRPHHGLPPATQHLVEVSPARHSQIASQVRCECHWQPVERRRESLTVLVLHGLEGSSRSQYVLGNASKLWSAGCNIIRMNMRNCGGTERLTPTLYHSGLSNDVLAVMQHFLSTEDLTRFALIGYSMGGNLVLKMAGELGQHTPEALTAVVGVSPAVDLGASADALHRPANRIYEWKFLNSLVNRYRRKAMLFPRAFDPMRANGVRSVRDFDERITALYSGFQSANDYYDRAAAARVLDRIAVPTLILHASDDPFIRFEAKTLALIEANPNIDFLETAHGGHCAFLAEPQQQLGYDGYWAEHAAMRFLLAHQSFGSDRVS
ncbi:MAG: alpha/beta fold hydrolase [Acidobacteriaceae bacterium]|nr:alpha/beta fold hydrolase [Acidobacteriaceae bacterium]